jgi:hypothetical protein
MVGTNGDNESNTQWLKPSSKDKNNDVQLSHAHVYTYMYRQYVYDRICNITTLFVGCKQGGVQKMYATILTPAYFFPMGKAICILDHSYVKNRAPEDLHLGGVESP